MNVLSCYMSDTVMSTHTMRGVQTQSTDNYNNHEMLILRQINIHNKYNIPIYTYVNYDIMSAGIPIDNVCASCTQ